MLLVFNVDDASNMLGNEGELVRRRGVYIRGLENNIIMNERLLLSHNQEKAMNHV